jgi:copper chaperone NosL
VRRAIGALVLAVVLAGCAAAAAGPPGVHWGIDECSHCHMILSEPRYAAVARSAAGEEARFDDLGCLRDWRRAHATESWDVWVHDARGEQWLPAASAWFVDTDTRTPMGSGILAFPDEAAARGVAAKAGPLRWSELTATPAP